MIVMSFQSLNSNSNSDFPKKMQGKGFIQNWMIFQIIFVYQETDRACEEKQSNINEKGHPFTPEQIVLLGLDILGWV